jgi:hypothetical protein
MTPKDDPEYVTGLDECNRLFTTFIRLLVPCCIILVTMTPDDLKPFLDKTVKLCMTDGEIAKVRVRMVDEEYGDLIVDVVETSFPEKYRDLSAAYTFGAADIASAELAQ